MAERSGGRRRTTGEVSTLQKVGLAESELDSDVERTMRSILARVAFPAGFALVAYLAFFGPR